MQNIKTKPLIVMIIMGILSFSNLVGLKIAGISVIIGVIFFFINQNTTFLLNESFHLQKTMVCQLMVHSPEPP